MKNNDRKAYLFIAPFVIVFLVFNLYPIFLTFYYSLTNYSGMGGIDNADFIGIDNYVRLVTDRYFYQAFFNTIRIWGFNFLVQMFIALGLALLFSDIRLKLKGVSLFRALFYLPNIITIASVALLFSILLDWNHGGLNQMLLSLGVINQPINWLNDPLYAQGAVALIGAWMWFGNSFIVLMAGISGISRDYYEAALIDGANWFQSFKYITLPQLKPILLYVLITSIIGGLQLFDLPMLLTDGQGSPQGALNTMVLYLYNQAFRYNNFGYGATLAYGLFFITVIFSAVTFRTMYRKES
ncbi:multiple sugar transport system permease protein [Pelagirhabdus alkalitolerans]|uniref:Multiple sugar transport system permease protein n=1 Tax=Pelagirhabdus alkalitolerans TaxID=1612202 RepID=A0A1G6K1L4_9BACI|nr:sugar ABC transporter permease [Pelagirhabdus alkalitolerans]SDC24176.1 multiple sugar transport system permease protein [Pelagirhabdus alkalitolerans]